jgi:hypothetical protein
MAEGTGFGITPANAKAHISSTLFKGVDLKIRRIVFALRRWSKRWPEKAGWASSNQDQPTPL